MKVIGNFIYMGMEKGSNKDGSKSWTCADILQGLQSEKLFLDDKYIWV